MRAILLARATVTSIFGLRANICASHDPLGAPRRLACRTTALAPMINRRRIVRSPRFETAPSFCLPPVDFCSGVNPSQAAKSRPAGNPSAAHCPVTRDGRRRGRDVQLAGQAAAIAPASASVRVRAGILRLICRKRNWPRHFADDLPCKVGCECRCRQHDERQRCRRRPGLFVVGAGLLARGI